MQHEFAIETSGYAWSAITHALGFESLFESIANEAPQRDVERRLPRDRVAELKAAGLGRLRLSREQGGAGLALPDLFQLARDLSYADSNIAHAFRNHFFAVEEALRAPCEPLYARLLREAAEGRTFGLGFGNAPPKRAGEAPSDVTGRLEWRAAQGFYVGSGIKPYSTGNLYADWLLGPARESREEELVQYLASTSAPGVDLDDDWPGFGQKLTGSGNTRFAEVHIQAGDIYPTPARAAHNGTWRYTFHQVYLTNAIAGIARRIARDSVQLIHERRRNFYHGQADMPRDEAVLQAQLGRIAAHAGALEAVIERAILALAAAFDAYGSAQADALALAATLKATEAKIVADDIAPQLAGWLIDLGSGSVVTTEGALDRHWRNIKVISSHNPRLYKERFLGDHLLNGVLPPTGAFF
ncbi:acyl-CoA dehydrogenase family protein [Bordetella muralis]|jgi:alkylation response protein AidB-like acyl-CoA dehydrogenase